MNIANILKVGFAMLLLSALLASPAQADRRSKEKKAEPIYPNATRVEPKIKPSSRTQRDMTKLYKAYEEENFDEVVVVAESLLANKSAGDYERATANQFIGMARSDKDDYAGAIAAYQKAIEANALPNDQHFQLMHQVAQMQNAEDRFEDANATLDRFIAETKVDKPEVSLLKGNILYELKRFDEAVPYIRRAIDTSEKPNDSWYQVLIQIYMEQNKVEEAVAVGRELVQKYPGDVRYLTNLAAIYSEADKYPEAAKVLEEARAQGLLSDERGYRQLYSLYANIDGQEAKVIEVVNDGLAKNILTPSVEIYNVLGQTYYFSDKIDQAIEAYKKAVPLAKDGESSLNLARLLSNEERHTEAKAAAKTALEKGLKRPGDAWIVIGRSEHGLGNKAGVVATYREAAKFPETKQAASDWLKKNAK